MITHRLAIFCSVQVIGRQCVSTAKDCPSKRILLFDEWYAAIRSLCVTITWWFSAAVRRLLDWSWLGQ